MTDEPRKDSRSSPPIPDRAAGDSTWAEAYAAGYGEGLRESLKEILQHASRGHTATELRVLVESRLARIPEDVELKRKSLTSPPRRPAWGALLRPPAPLGGARPEVGPVPALPAFSAGNSYLFREERPREGVRFALEFAPRHARVVWVSALDPPAVADRGTEIVALRPSAPPAAGGSSSGVGPGEVAGQLQRCADAGDPTLAYVDALEFFLTEYGTEPTIRFATWLGNWAKESRSTSVVSLDPAAMEERDLRRLQRAFSVVA